MATYSIEEIKKAVRIILDENEDKHAFLDLTQPDITPIDPDTLQTEDITEAMITRAVNRVYKIAPVSMLSDAYKSADYTAEDWDNTDAFCSSHLLPADMLRMMYIKADSWSKPVTVFLADTDDKYLELRSKFAGIRASKDRPRAAVTISSSADGLQVEAYPKIDGTDKGHIRYLSLASVADGNINIDVKCYDAVLYMVANLYYVTLGESNRAQAMANEVAEMLGVSNIQE